MPGGWQGTQSLTDLTQAEFEEDLCLVTHSWGGFGLWHLMKGHSGQIHLVVQLTYDFSMYSLTTQNPADKSCGI